MRTCLLADAIPADEPKATALFVLRFAVFRLAVCRGSDDSRLRERVRDKQKGLQSTHRPLAQVAVKRLRLYLIRYAAPPTNLATAAWRHNRRGYSLQWRGESLLNLLRRDQTPAQLERY